MIDPNIISNIAFAEYLIPIFVFIASVVIAKIAYVLIKRYVRKFAAKTKTKFDDLILNYIEKPFILLIILLGIMYCISLITMREDVSNTVKNIVYTLLILDIAWFIIGLTNAIFENYFVKITKKTKTKLDDMLLPIAKKFISITIIFITIMIILSNFNYDITALLGGFGIAGIAIAMAAQDTIKDILGGVAIITNRPFEVGDAINIDGISGIVKDISIRCIRLRTWNGTMITIPNSKIGSASIENYSRAEERRIVIDLGVTYETSGKKIEKALKLLKNIANSERGVEKKKTNTYFWKYGDSAIMLRLIYYINEEGLCDFFGLQHRINLKIKKTFDKEKIDLAYPTQTIYIKK